MTVDFGAMVNSVAGAGGRPWEQRGLRGGHGVTGTAAPLGPALQENAFSLSVAGADCSC